MPQLPTASPLYSSLDTVLAFLPFTTPSFSPLSEHFEPVNARPDAPSLPFTLWKSHKSRFSPVVSVRRARIEDHDDLMPIFDKQTDTITSLYGPYFLAELIQSGSESNEQRSVTNLVGEIDGRSIGFLSVTDDIDVALLRQCFALQKFSNLCAPGSANRLDASSPLYQLLLRCQHASHPEYDEEKHSPATIWQLARSAFDSLRALAKQDSALPSRSPSRTGLQQDSPMSSRPITPGPTHLAAPPQSKASALGITTLDIARLTNELGLPPPSPRQQTTALSARLHAAMAQSRVGAMTSRSPAHAPPLPIESINRTMMQKLHSIVQNTLYAIPGIDNSQFLSALSVVDPEQLPVSATVLISYEQFLTLLGTVCERLTGAVSLNFLIDQLASSVSHVTARPDTPATPLITSTDAHGDGDDDSPHSALVITLLCVDHAHSEHVTPSLLAGCLASHPHRQWLCIALPSDSPVPLSIERLFCAAPWKQSNSIGYALYVAHRSALLCTPDSVAIDPITNAATVQRVQDFVATIPQPDQRKSLNDALTLALQGHSAAHRQLTVAQQQRQRFKRLSTQETNPTVASHFTELLKCTDEPTIAAFLPTHAFEIRCANLTIGLALCDPCNFSSDDDKNSFALPSLRKRFDLDSFVNFPALPHNRLCLLDRFC